MIYIAIWFGTRFVCIVAIHLALVTLAQGGRTALIYAARNGHAGCVQCLLAAGADKEATTKARFVDHSHSVCLNCFLTNMGLMLWKFESIFSVHKDVFHVLFIVP